MATDFTTHYNLDKYTATDKPNLRDQYNAAMDKIDTQLYAASTDATDAKATANAANQAVSGKASQSDLNALSNIIPANQFSAQNTIKNALDAKASQLDLNTLSDKVDVNKSALSQSNVLLYGGKTMTRNLNWSNIITLAIQNGEGVYFPSGTYYIDSTVNVSDLRFFVAQGCRFLFEGANSKFAFTNILTKLYIMGATFATTEGTKTAIEVQGTSHTGLHLIGCYFYGFTDAAFINRNLGIQISSCLFLECNEGCILATDFTIINAGFYNCNHAIHASYKGYDGSTLDHGGFSTILGCQFWVNATEKPNASFVYTQSELTNIAFVGCDFDTTARLLDARTFKGIVIDGCRFLWDSSIAGQKSCLFYIRGGNYSSDTEVISSASVTNCVFTTPHLINATDTYEIVAFDGEANAMNFGKIGHGYESHGCLLTIPTVSTPNATGHLFAIPLGYVHGYASPAPNTPTHFKCVGTNLNSNIPSRLVIHSDFSGIKLLHYTTTCKVYFTDSLSDVRAAKFGMGSDKFSDVVFGLEYRAVNSIFMVGALRNAYMVNDSSTPSNVSKIRVMTEAIV